MLLHSGEFIDFGGCLVDVVTFEGPRLGLLEIGGAWLCHCHLGFLTIELLFELALHLFEHLGGDSLTDFRLKCV